MADTPTAPIRALSEARRERVSTLQAFCGVLLTALGVLSGVVWNSLSSTVAAQGLRVDANAHELAEQKARIAVLEVQREAQDRTLVRVEHLLDLLAAQRGLSVPPSP